MKTVTAPNVLLWCAGMVVGLTAVFAPIHELGHWMIGAWQNTDVTIAGWARSVTEWNVNHAWVGYMFEILVWGSFACVVAHAGGLSAFALGHATGAYIIGFGSSDIHVYLPAALVALRVRSSQIPGLITLQMVKYGIMCGIVLLLAHMVVVKLRK